MNASARVLFGGLAVGGGVAAAVWLVPAAAFAAPSPQNHGAVTPGPAAHSTHHVAPSAASVSVPHVASNAASSTPFPCSSCQVQDFYAALLKVQSQEAKAAMIAANVEAVEQARLIQQRASVDAAKSDLRSCEPDGK
jgi:hypothetical protein